MCITYLEGWSNIFVNEFVINENTTTIIAGKKRYEVLIDTEDLPRLQILGKAVQVKGNRNNQFMYPFMLIDNGRDEAGRKRYTSLMLSRFIANAPKGLVVDHINHDTMDNRKENLRVIEPSENSMNRAGPNKNSVSGYRNVAWMNGKWCVQLQINGVNRILGAFKNVDKAGAFAKEMRKKYYGEFAGQ